MNKYNFNISLFIDTIIDSTRTIIGENIKIEYMHKNNIVIYGNIPYIQDIFLSIIQDCAYIKLDNNNTIYNCIKIKTKITDRCLYIIFNILHNTNELLNHNDNLIALKQLSRLYDFKIINLNKKTAIFIHDNEKFNFIIIIYINNMINSEIY